MLDFLGEKSVCLSCVYRVSRHLHVLHVASANPTLRNLLQQNLHPLDPATCEARIMTLERC